VGADRVLAVGLAGLAFASFAWAVRGFFLREGALHPGMRLIAVGGLATMAAQGAAFGWAPAVPRLTGAVGATLYALSLVVFWGAVVAHRRKRPAIAFSEAAPHQLVVGGIYGIVRHPFYLSYSLAWVAGVVVTGQLWLLTSVLGMGALYLRAALLEEAAFSSGPFAHAYREYQSRAGMFLPAVIPSSVLAGRAAADPRRQPAP